MTIPRRLEAEALHTAAGTLPRAIEVKAMEDCTVDGRKQRKAMPLAMVGIEPAMADGPEPQPEGRKQHEGRAQRQRMDAPGAEARQDRLARQLGAVQEEEQRNPRRGDRAHDDGALAGTGQHAGQRHRGQKRDDEGIEFQLHRSLMAGGGTNGKSAGCLNRRSWARASAYWPSPPRSGWASRSERPARRSRP